MTGQVDLNDAQSSWTKAVFVFLLLIIFILI